MVEKAIHGAARGIGGEVFRLGEFPVKNELGDLLRLTGEALDFFPPLYLQSLFGPVRGWLPPHRTLSEFRILDPWRLARTLRFLTAVSVPSFSRGAPAWVEAFVPPQVHRILYRPTRFFEVPDPWGGRGGFPRERWFFINGVATDAAVARMNGALISRLFHRPVTVIHNATNSLGLDLWEAAVGKEFRVDPEVGDAGTFTEPALEATIALLDTLNRDDLDRVVVLAHSQGTLIVANVLRALVKALEVRRERRSAEERGRTVARALTVRAAEQTRLLPLRRELVGCLAALLEGDPIGKIRKLEIYTFANAADRMRYAFFAAGRGRPWLEHFANEHDLVARLGVLSPCRRRAGCALVEIDGPVYERYGAWGHLLNEHHLFAIEDHLRRPDRGGGNPYPPQQKDEPREPRLYGYFQGATPPPL